MEYIVGIPSGQILNLSTKELYKLLKYNMIDWNGGIDDFIFEDILLSSIIDNLNSNIEIGDNIIAFNNRKGVVRRIIDYNKGDIINGKDLSRLYDSGQKLYLIYFNDTRSNTSIYTINQIKKNHNNCIFVYN